MTTRSVVEPLWVLVRVRHPAYTVGALAAITAVTTALCSVPLPGAQSTGDIYPLAYMVAPMFLPVVVALGLVSPAAWIEQQARRRGWLTLYSGIVCLAAVLAVLPSAVAAHAFGSPTDVSPAQSRNLADFVGGNAENALVSVGLTLICLRWLSVTWAWALPTVLVLAGVLTPLPLLSLLVNHETSGSHLAIGVGLLVSGLALQWRSGAAPLRRSSPPC
ncbi:hypothetical protein [Bogoriella caseilytica]|nr:hypothetical protein [Bogoriella caseilytica]